ncbi:MAG: hypothetical protein R2825_27305 [Saprospiraceae bacterium]
MTLEDALSLVTVRGKLFKEQRWQELHVLSIAMTEEGRYSRC